MEPEVDCTEVLPKLLVPDAAIMVKNSAVYCARC